MKNKYLLGTAAFSNFDLLQTCVNSWPKNLNRLVIIDRYDPKSPAFTVIPDDITAVGYREHMGCSTIWNKIILTAVTTGYDGAIIVGSDTEFKDNFLEEWIEQFENGNYIFATTLDQGFNCFGLTLECIEKVGMFDENFFPAYFEDNDYWLRAKLSGVDIGDIGDATKLEHYGSATIRKSVQCNQANAFSFDLNQRYFWSKWGAHQDSAISKFYTTPFNSGNDLRYWERDEAFIQVKREAWEKC